MNVHLIKDSEVHGELYFDILDLLNSYTGPLNFITHYEDYSILDELHEIEIYTEEDFTESIDKGIVYTDFHADPTLNKDSYPEDYYIRYRESETANSSGSLVASFSGNHGWYWLNIEEHPIKITLEVSGFYSEIKELGRSFQ